MRRGRKYFNKDVVYVSFKKHLCPNCCNKLKTVKVSKIVNFRSVEAKEYDFYLGTGTHKVFNPNIEFIWKEFECPNCKSHFTVDALKKIEGIEISGDNNKSDDRNRTKGLIIFFLLGVFAVVIIGLVKYLLNN